MLNIRAEFVDNRISTFRAITYAATVTTNEPTSTTDHSTSSLR